MAQNHEPNAALGRYIEMLHRRVKVDGKLLTRVSSLMFPI